MSSDPDKFTMGRRIHNAGTQVYVKKTAIYIFLNVCFFYVFVYVF